MTVLGAGRGPSTLEAVVLSFDEFQFLQETLELGDVPTVLSPIGRYDNETDHSRAMSSAAESLAQRDLLIQGEVHRDLEDRMQGLNRPHWALEVRWFIDGHVNRLCVAKGDELDVVALRGPNSYVVDEAGPDLPGTVVAALGPAEPLELYGTNAPTEQLAPIFGDTGDSTRTAERLAKIGKPAHDATALASALVEIHSMVEISGVVYGDGTRDFSPAHIAVFNTRHGRFVATVSVAEDGTKWSSLSSGTTARLRTAVHDLIESLPLRAEFKPPTIS